MTSDTPAYAAESVGQRLYAMLTPFPVVCFFGALAADLAYLNTLLHQWETFSVWLLSAGLIMAGVAAVVGLADYLIIARGHGLRLAWPALAGNAVAVLLSLVNVFVHSRDGYTAVIPTGLILSAVVVLILLVTGWAGWDMAYRRPVDAAR